MDDYIKNNNQAADVDNKVIEKTIVVEKKSTSGWFLVALLLAGILFCFVLLGTYELVNESAEPVYEPAEPVYESDGVVFQTHYDSEYIRADIDGNTIYKIQITTDATNIDGTKVKNVQVDYSVKFYNRIVGTETAYFGDIDAGSNKVKITDIYVTLTDKEMKMRSVGVLLEVEIDEMRGQW